MLRREAFLNSEGKIVHRLKEERMVDFALKIPLAYDVGTVLSIPNDHNNFCRIALVKEVFFDLEGRITYGYDPKDPKGQKGQEELGFSKAQYTLISQPGSYFDYKLEEDEDAHISELLTDSSQTVRTRGYFKSIALRCIRRVFPGGGVPICPGTYLDVMEHELLGPGVEVLSVDPANLVVFNSSWNCRDYEIALEKWIDRLVEGDEEAIKYRDEIEVYLH